MILTYYDRPYTTRLYLPSGRITYRDIGPNSADTCWTIFRNFPVEIPLWVEAGFVEKISGSFDDTKV